MINGVNPAGDGVVLFFNAKSGPPPSAENYWRVPDKVVRADSDGKFDVVLPEGDYYIRAIRRTRGGQIGPPRKEDLILYKSSPEGTRPLYAVKSGQVLDLGTFSEAKPFQPRNKNVPTGIAGSVRDAQGNPMEGFFVMAYSNPGCVGRPLFISERSGKDGRYILGVQEGRTYYLRARDAYGAGPPRDQIVTGLYGGKIPVPVEVKKNSITDGIDIAVARYRVQANGR